MSTSRRLFDDPRNAEVVNGRAVQRCCDGNAPYWDTYRIRDWEDAWDEGDRNMTANKQSDSILVQDDTGLSDNNKEVLEFDIKRKSDRQQRPYEGVRSGGRPEQRIQAGLSDAASVDGMAGCRVVL